MENTTNDQADRVSRRGSLVRMGGFLATALTGGGLAGGLADRAGGSGSAALAAGAVSCVLTPELTEGPYYIDVDKVRRNITEGRRGVPLELRLKVLDARTCKPIRGAWVEIWQCDALGVYSGVGSAAGKTFLRGQQRTNAQGVATLETIYPGWYPGRTVHIHLKVFVGGSVVHTGQLFFDDKVTDGVYRRAPYKTRGARTTRNANDSIYVNGGSKSLVKVTRDGSGYVGTLSMGVQR